MMLRQTIDVNIVPLLNDIDIIESGQLHPCRGCNCDRMNRSHEGCGEEWDAGDVVWPRLRLDDQFDPGACLELLGEVALLAEGNDVVVKGLVVAVRDDGNSEGGVLRPVLEVRLLAELLTVPKKVMVC
jgi:hypothetical protein